MENLFSKPIVSMTNSEIEQFETYKREFEDDIKSMDTKTALEYIKNQIKSNKNVPLKDELYYNGINFMREKEQEIKNQIILEKKVEKLNVKLKSIKYLKNEFLKIKKEYEHNIKQKLNIEKQKLKDAKTEIKELKQERRDTLNKIKSNRNQPITNTSKFLTKEEINKLKQTNKNLLNELKKHPLTIKQKEIKQIKKISKRKRINLF